MKKIIVMLFVTLAIATSIPLPIVPIDTAEAASPFSNSLPVDADQLFAKIVHDGDYIATSSLVNPRKIISVLMKPQHQDVFFVSNSAILNGSDGETVIIQLVNHPKPTSRSRFPFFDNTPDCALVALYKISGGSTKKTTALFAMDSDHVDICRDNWEFGKIHYVGVVPKPQIKNLYQNRFQYALFTWGGDRLDLIANALENGSVLTAGSTCDDPEEQIEPWTIAINNKKIDLLFFCTTGGQVDAVALNPSPANDGAEFVLFRNHAWFLQIKTPIEDFLDQY